MNNEQIGEIAELILAINTAVIELTKIVAGLAEVIDGKVKTVENQTDKNITDEPPRFYIPRELTPDYRFRKSQEKEREK